MARSRSEWRWAGLRTGAYSTSQVLGLLRALGLATEGEEMPAVRRALDLGVLIPKRRSAHAARLGAPGRLDDYFGLQYPWRFDSEFLDWLEEENPDTETPLEAVLRLGALNEFKGGPREPTDEST